MYGTKNTLKVTQSTVMRFNGAVISKETGLGQVYDNPIQVLSRNKKIAKWILKLFGKVIECKQHGYAITNVCSPFSNYEVFSHRG